MDSGQEAMIDQLKKLMDQVDEPLKKTHENVHQGYETETLIRFLKARDWNVYEAYLMLVECLHWRVKKQIDKILEKPINFDIFVNIRNSQLIGLSGYTWEGLPVFGIGVGLSTFDKATKDYYLQSHIQINEYRDRVILPSASKKYGRPITTCVKVLDMSDLKFSTLNNLNLLIDISTIDDKNYPEKTSKYYIVNAPPLLKCLMKMVYPRIQKRTAEKIQLLPGTGHEELLKIMDEDSLPHFSSRRSAIKPANCFSASHSFHQQLYQHIESKSASRSTPDRTIKQQPSLQQDMSQARSVDNLTMAGTLEHDLVKQGIGLCGNFKNIKISDPTK